MTALLFNVLLTGIRFCSWSLFRLQKQRFSRRLKDWKHAEFLSVLILAEIGLPSVPNYIFIYIFPQWRQLQPDDIVLDLTVFPD